MLGQKSRKDKKDSRVGWKARQEAARQRRQGKDDQRATIAKARQDHLAKTAKAEVKAENKKPLELKPSDKA